MKITIIYDNETLRGDLQANWGFAALVDSNGRRILFDTGASGALLLSNMKALEIAPEGIDDVFISHFHFDHTGGLSAFLDRHGDVTVWIPPSFRGVKNARSVIEVGTPKTLFDGIHSTGELEGIEQSLCVQTRKGILVVAGCSHPRMKTILGQASRFGEVYGIIGGLHGNTAESLNGLKFICPTHCTQYQHEIRSLYPEQYTQGGAGKVIEII
ncbi:MAG: MBL fold metallo-hydrolase [Deltaproteobacteria bacterium]|nr:MBL fold metallo-hydrolase [Deltaproteobacteria bacterium]